MTLLTADWRPPPRRPEWAWSSVRPVTLLIACGIVMIAAILIVTGLVAGHLRDQALATTEGELARLDAVVAEFGNRSIQTGDTLLHAASSRLRQLGGEKSTAFAETATAPEVEAILAGALGPASPLAAVAVISRDGVLLNTMGWWPPSAVDFGSHDFFDQLRTKADLDFSVGAAIVDPRTGAPLIPLARRVRESDGGTIGFVAGMLPAADFEGFFSRVPLGAGGVISLVRGDGAVLVQYPPADDGTGRHAAAGGARGGGQWRIEASHELSGYPLSVTVARSGDVALDDWARQAMLLSALALLSAFGVAVMTYMIARQFRVHAALASVRAEKIEVEHARLVTEAELLKKERLSVLGQLTATVAHELRNPLSAIRNTLFSVKEMASGTGLKLDRPIGPHGAQHRTLQPDHRRSARIRAAPANCAGRRWISRAG